MTRSYDKKPLVLSGMCCTPVPSGTSAMARSPGACPALRGIFYEGAGRF